MSLVDGLFGRIGDVEASFDESEVTDLASHVRHEKRRFSHVDRRLAQILVLLLVGLAIEAPTHLVDLALRISKVFGP